MGGVKEEGLKDWDCTSLCFTPSCPLKEFTAVEVSGLVVNNLQYVASVCERCPRAQPLWRELSEQPYLLPSPCHCRGSTVVWLLA